VTTKNIEITAEAARILVGVEGEAVTMSTPVTWTTWPGALRVWVPRDRSRITAASPPVSWARLRRLAGSRREPAEITR
jgi:hypothetical protein